MGVPVIDNAVNFVFGKDGVLGTIITSMTDFVEDLDDFMKSLRDDLSELTSEMFTNIRAALHTVFTDMLEKLYGIPQALAQSLLKMFRDPEFWRAVLLFLSLIVMAEGIAAASAATMGTKTAAFFKAAGATYHGMHLDFLVKTHRVAYLVSPAYREDFQEILGDLPERMIDAGIDIQYATNLFHSMAALGDSFGAIAGKDWELTQSDFAVQMEQLGSVTGETLQQWGMNPGLMIDWIDEHMVRPMYDEASGRINGLSEGLKKVTDAADVLVGRVADIRSGFGTVAGDLDDLYGTNYREELNKGLITFDKIIYEQWAVTSDMFRELAGIMEVQYNTQSQRTKDYILFNTIEQNTRTKVLHNDLTQLSVYNMRKNKISQS